MVYLSRLIVDLKSEGLVILTDVSIIIMTGNIFRIMNFQYMLLPEIKEMNQFSNLYWVFNVL